MDKKEIKMKINTGWIRINMIFEMIGNPKKHVEDTLKAYMANIKTDSQVIVLNEDFGAPEEISKGLWSTFVEADMLVESLEKLTWLCFNFTPASIEVIEPDNYNFKANMLQDWINDLLSKLHEVGALTKQFSSQHKLMTNNMNRVIKNFIIYCVSKGESDIESLSKNILGPGSDPKQIEPFLDALFKEGKLELDKSSTKAAKIISEKKAPAKKSSKKKK